MDPFRNIPAQVYVVHQGQQRKQPEITLKVEQKRQLVYAALLRYSPEAIPLRERVLDRIILSSLFGSALHNPFTIEKIKANLHFGYKAPEIRVDVIRETLNRLEGEKRIVREQLADSSKYFGFSSQQSEPAYYIVANANSDLTQATESAESLMHQVSRRMLSGCSCDLSIGELVCRIFLIECFTRFGRKIAKAVIGQIDNADLPSSHDLDEAFRVAVSTLLPTTLEDPNSIPSFIVGDSPSNRWVITPPESMKFERTTRAPETAKDLIPEEDLELLRARCRAIFGSKDPQDHQLMFRLTQGHFLGQLLGLEPQPFNPIIENNYQDSVFYLDISILVPTLLRIPEDVALFDEIARVAKHLNIQLRLTRASIAELHRISASKTEEINHIVSKLPNYTVEKLTDPFIAAYLNLRKETPQLTVGDFFDNFKQEAERIVDKEGITIDEADCEPVLRNPDYSEVALRFTRAAGTNRGYTKFQSPPEYYVIHYALVLNKRESNPKVFFLTRGQFLVGAALDMSKGEQPFCLSIEAFLQTISPFLITDQEQQPAANLFCFAINDGLFPDRPLFDTKELALLATMADDIQSTPSDNILEAFEFVRRDTLLQGRQLTETDHHEIVLGIRKYLNSSTEERVKHLTAENLDVNRKYKGEFDSRVAADKKINRQRLDIDGLERSVLELSTTVQEQGARIYRERQYRRTICMLVGFVLGIALWLLTSPYFITSAERLNGLLSPQSKLNSIIDVVGALVFAVPALFFVRHAKWRIELQLVISTLVIAIGLAFSSILTDQVWSNWSAYVQIAGLIATGLLYLREIQKEKPDHRKKPRREG